METLFSSLPSRPAPTNQSITAVLIYQLNLVTILMANSPLTPTGYPGILFKSEDAMEEFVVKLVAQATNPRYASGFLLQFMLK